MTETPDFSSLRRSIKHLQTASVALEKEKHAMEAEFKNMLRELDNAAHKTVTRLSFWDKTKVAYGFSPGRKEPSEHEGHAEESLREWFSNVWTFGGDSEEEHDDNTQALSKPTLHPSHWATHKISIHNFILAGKRVASVNRKLIAFERGFISNEGIKDRVWYRHLGVAPGKWLGMSLFNLDPKLRACD